MNELQIEYLKLKPPVYKNNTSSDAIWFTNEEMRLIKESEYPDYILKLNNKVRASAATRVRHKILYELQIKAEKEKDDTLLNWVLNMLVNETSGFVKKFIARSISDKNLYNEAYNQCFAIIFQEFPKIGSKLDEYTLSTLLTRPLRHEISNLRNMEKFGTSASKSANAQKVAQAISFFQQQGVKPTLYDLALKTNLSEKSVRQSLDIIRASQKKDIESDEIRNQISNDGDPLSNILKSERKTVIQQELRHFSPFEIKCITERYDLSGTHGEQKSPSLIARELGTTANEVNKAINRVLKKMKQNKEIKALVFGSKPIVKENDNSDLRNISKYYEDAFSLMDDLADPVASKNISNGSDDASKKLKLPWE